MTFDFSIALSFIEIVVALTILGWALDIWVRTRLYALYPAFGVLVFGAVGGLLTYISGKFLPALIGLTLGFGVLVSLFFFFKSRPRLRFHWPNADIWVLMAVVFSGVVLMLIQASQYGIPGGIDSAVHSHAINGLLASGQPIRGSYPLGFHVLVYFFERMFRLSQAHTFLSLYIIFYISVIASIVAVVRRNVDRRVAAFIVIGVSIVDVSLYNNLLNGSGTHLLGMLLVAVTVALAVALDRAKRWRYIVGLSLAMAALWYYHYPSLFFMMFGWWAWRLTKSGPRDWRSLVAIGIGTLLSIPIQRYLMLDPAYIGTAALGIGAIVAGEIVITFSRNWIVQILQSRLTRLVLALVAGWLFYTHSDNFLYLPTWYGTVLMQLAGAGLLGAIFFTRRVNQMALISFAGMSMLYATLTSSWAPSQAHVMIELVYYYGFTFSLILLGSVGVIEMHRLLTQPPMRHLVLTLMSVYAVLVISARSFDSKLIHPLQPNDQPISRYETSSGFGIFYTKNDVQVAEWAKNNLPKQAIIMNPGGLYNAWAASTERRVVLSTYNVPTIYDGPEAIATVRNLLQRQAQGNIGQILARRVEYIILPEKFSLAIYNSRARLLYQKGQARLYQFTDNPENGNWTSADISDPARPGSLKVVTKAERICRYCGDTFYFADSDALQAYVLNPKETLKIYAPFSLQSATYDVYVDRLPADLEYSIDGSDWKESTDEKILTDFHVLAEQVRLVTVRNPGPNQILFHGIGMKRNP